MTPQWHNVSGRILSATISTPDLKNTQALYANCLRYNSASSGVVEKDLALSWGAPAMAGRPYVLMIPRSESTYALRLVETAPVADFTPMHTYGWGALELSVMDVEDVHAAVKKSAFRIIGAPRDIMFGAPVRPMQCTGPAREALFLTQVLKTEHPEGPEMARAFVDQLFIAILATPDCEKALTFYEKALGYRRGETFEIGYRSLNQAFGLAPDTPQSFTMLQSPDGGIIQVDQYPKGAGVRPTQPGYLPPAISMVSLVVPSLADVKADFLGPPFRSPTAPYDGRASAVVKGVAGEWIELVEAA